MSVTTPVPDNTDIGETISGKLFGRELLYDQNGVDAVGVVGASPAANTLLGRLKAMTDAVTALAPLLDGLEALAAAPIAAGSNLIGSVSIDASLKSGTATPNTPAVNAASGNVLAANANRKGGTIYNPNAGALLLNLAGGNAATQPHVRLVQYQSYEVGAGYTGQITGALETGSGVANVVEFS